MLRKMAQPLPIQGDSTLRELPRQSVGLSSLASRARDAETALRSRLAPSPLIESPALSRELGCTVLLKCDFLLPTGSFKYRGAFEKLRQLRGSEARVITASTGNHGLAVATVGREMGIDVEVHAPASASSAKLDAIAALGAEITLHETDQLSVELAARAQAERSGRVYVSPYNDIDVAAGQGGCAVEIIGQADVDAIAVSVGGGGLLAGIGSVVRTSAPKAQILAAWPTNAPSLLHAMRAGRAVKVDESPTLSDATSGAVEDGSLTIPLARAIAPVPVLCSEAEIGHALALLARAERLIVEGAAALACAALFQQRDRLAGKTVAVVLCGRNIAFDKFRATIAEYGEVPEMGEHSR
tara:strand:- start:1325 stop:2389 length:1065 start_codon:yes stop_codon:yes gene_type:complete